MVTASIAYSYSLCHIWLQPRWKTASTYVGFKADMAGPSGPSGPSG